MKPKPFWVLNHLTVPVGMRSPFRNIGVCTGQVAGCRISDFGNKGWSARRKVSHTHGRSSGRLSTLDMCAVPGGNTRTHNEVGQNPRCDRYPTQKTREFSDQPHAKPIMLPSLYFDIIRV